MIQKFLRYYLMPSKKQGAATNTQMTVKQITQARETQSYPQQGIRSCNAIVETNSVKICYGLQHYLE